MSRGRGSCSLSSTTSSSRRQCDGGGRSGLFSNCDSFYQLCQLSALPASILGLSEQTKTGATRGRGRQSQGPCSYYWRRRIHLAFVTFGSCFLLTATVAFPPLTGNCGTSDRQCKLGPSIGNSLSRDNRDWQIAANLCNCFLSNITTT